MKLFLDTEFTGLRKDSTLISLALVSERHEHFYAEFTDYNAEQCDDWINANVIANLQFEKRQPFTEFHHDSVIMKNSKTIVAEQLRLWFERLQKTHRLPADQKFVVWTDVGAWDWVLFADLFGGAFSMPSCLHYINRDLATALERAGCDPDADRKEFVGPSGSENLQTDLPAWVRALPAHNALYDAYLNYQVHDNLFAELKPK